MGGQVGESVNTAGDLNGDTYDDVLVGGKGSAGQNGRVYALSGSSTGIADCDLASCTPHAVVTGVLSGDWLSMVR